jgi:hypothetical protein
VSGSQPVKTDEDGIPILDELVSADGFEAPQPAEPDVLEPERLGQLLQTEPYRTLLGDLSEDLHKLVAWKVEELLKEEMQELIHEASQRALERVQSEIHTQLTLALPDLLAKIVRHSQR